MEERPPCPAAAARAVIFDLDGTLADTLESIAGAVNACLLEVGGRPRPADDYRLLVGDGLDVLCRRVLADRAGGASGEAVEDLKRRIMARYDSRLLEGVALYPGVEDLLVRLRTAGIPMAVLSNKPERHVRALVEALVPAGTFAAVIGRSDRLPRKPDPAGALEAAEAMRVAPRRCLVAGDSAVDVRTARAAGMISAGVLWGFRGREELEAAGAGFLVAEPEEIAALVVEPERRSRD